MARKPAQRRPLHTPASSTGATPLSSAYPSTCVSEVETEDDVPMISIASLTLDTPLIQLKRRRVPAKPFPFLSLPSELRLKVYQHFFADAGDAVLDLEPDNYKRIHKSLGLMRVCRQIHDEATHLYYSTRAVRVFPTYPGKYFKTKKPMLARMKRVQRQCLTSLELRLGPGWNAPPRGWVVNDALGLKDCVRVRKLTVFVECDPSDGVFKGFRRSEGFYETFSRNLLADVLAQMPAVDVVEFDGYRSVKKAGMMMTGLLGVAGHTGRIITWGPERGWADGPEPKDDKTFQFEGMAMLGANVVAVA